jgi:hypothetical protein
MAYRVALCIWMPVMGMGGAVLVVLVAPIMTHAATAMFRRLALWLRPMFLWHGGEEIFAKILRNRRLQRGLDDVIRPRIRTE